MIDRLQAAAEALNRGDPEPFAALIAEECEWRGVPYGHLWWKREITIPASAISKLESDMVTLGATKEEVGSFPSQRRH